MVKLNKSVLFSLFSNLFHYYSFAVYGFSAVILSPIFFSSSDPEVSKLLGLVTLSMLIFLRPLGNLIFGHIGDKYGRKTALTYSLIAITVATTCIGLIPPYASIGFLSGILLIICLFVQGICMGGQYTGALIFIQEHTKKQNAALCSGLMVSVGFLGALLGTVTSLLFYDSQELDWTWRLPFLLTFILGIILYNLTYSIEETPDFIDHQNKDQVEKIPFMRTIKHHKTAFVASIFISSIPISMFYLAATYLPNFYSDANNVDSASIALGLTCLAQVLGTIFVPLFGYLADKVGRENQLKATSILIMISPIILFYFMESFNNMYSLIIGVVALSLFVSLYSGVGPAFLSENFPVIGRYSGMGVGISIGEGLFGGLSPFICITLEKALESKIAPAYYIMFLGMLSYVGIFLLRSSKQILRSQEQKDDILKVLDPA